MWFYHPALIFWMELSGNKPAMRRVGVHFGGMRIVVTKHVAGEFYHGALHSQADSQKRNIIFPCKTDSLEFPFNASIAESRSNQYPRTTSQFLSYIFCRKLF